MLSRTYSRAVTAAAVIAIAQPALGQNLPSTSPDRGAPIEDHAISPDAVKVEFDAGTSAKQASIKFNLLQLANSLASDRQSTRDTSQQLTLKVSTPWDGENDAEPLNLDGLATGTEFTLEYSFFGTRSRSTDTPRSLAIEADARQACTEKAEADFKVARSELGDAAPADVVEALTKAHDKKLATCERGDTRTLIKAYLPGKQRAYAAEFFPDGAWGLGLHASVGFDRYGFVDPASLAPGKTSKVGWSAGASLTKYFSLSPTAITATMDYEAAWDAGDKKILCPAGGGPGPVTCVNNFVGPPVLERSAIGRLNVRHRFSDSKGRVLVGVSPNVSYNITNDTWGAELPIYLLPGEDDRLTGGFKIGYTSEKKDVTFGIFIGAAFGLAAD